METPIPSERLPDLPPVSNWRTTDQDEINRRRLRAARETMRFRNLTPEQPFFSNFSVESASGQTYQVELRSLKPLARRWFWRPRRFWQRPPGSRRKETR